MTLRQRFSAVRRRDDSGAALIIALVFVTVISVAVAAVLSYADANVRATVALRNQSDGTATADAAAEAAINALRNSTYTGPGGDCLGPSGVWRLNAFHPTDSAVVTCTRDNAISVVGTSGLPTVDSLRALQADSAAEDGIFMRAGNSSGGINVSGHMESAGNIDMDRGTLNVNGDVTAKSCSGTINASLTKLCASTAPTVGDPLYSTPVAPTGNAQISSGCTIKRTFRPGIFSSLSDLNNAYSSCPFTTVFDFRPGIYYFSFSGVWTINKGTTVGGSTMELSNIPPSIPGACPNPLTTNSNDGVTFVFGDEAQLAITDNARVEICGRRPTTSGNPAIAFYGLKAGLGSGPRRVPPQSGCIRRFSGGGPRCAVISTDNRSDTVRFYVHGHIYMPRARIELDLRDSTLQFLTGGVTVRSFRLLSPGGSTFPAPLSSGPPVPPTPGRTVVLLSVYVCAEATSCTTASGKLRLRVKAGLADAGAAKAGPRAVTIYNWSVQR